MTASAGGRRHENGPARSPSEFAWLLEQFVSSVPGINHAIFVSLDGLQLVSSRGIGRDTGDGLAALTAGLLATADQAGSVLGMGASEYLTIRTPAGYLLLMRVAELAGLTVATTAGCDLRVVAYHMTQFSSSVGHLLTPPMRAELQRMTASG